MFVEKGVYDQNDGSIAAFLIHFESSSWKTLSNYSIYVVECSFQLSVDSYEMYMHLMVLFIFLQVSYHLNVIDIA